MTTDLSPLPEMFTYDRHRFMCADITLTHHMKCLMGIERADVAYSDPPWGPGNQKFWHTMNHRGSAPRTTWETFLDAFACTTLEYTKINALVFVEMGNRWVKDLDAAMGRYSFVCRERWSILYGPKSTPLPNTLSLYTLFPSTIDAWPVKNIVLPDPPHGEPVTHAVLSAVVKPGMVVLDPCTGLGMTARITHKLGATFRGSELNRERLLRAIKGVEKGRRV